MGDKLQNDFIDSVMGEDPNKDAWYVEEDDVVVDNGTYPAVIIDLTKQDIITRKNVHADLYKPTYQIAKGKYKGVTIGDKGIWRFRSDPSSMHNKSSRGNIIYKGILDMLDIPLESVEVDKRILKRLPELTLERVSGKSVLIDVQEDDYKSNYGRLANKVATLHSKWEDANDVRQDSET
tara:strand:- start:707 stop:1243 length:537 start_codon:yes stop_codon:yes gene_type:complete